MSPSNTTASSAARKSGHRKGLDSTYQHRGRGCCFSLGDASSELGLRALQPRQQLQELFRGEGSDAARNCRLVCHEVKLRVFVQVEYLIQVHAVYSYLNVPQEFRRKGKTSVPMADHGHDELPGLPNCSDPMSLEQSHPCSSPVWQCCCQSDLNIAASAASRAQTMSHKSTRRFAAQANIARAVGTTRQADTFP